MTANLTTFQPLLKQLYPNDKVLSMVNNNNPLLAMMQKRTDFEGELQKVPIKFGNNNGRSSTFANAKANVTSSKNRAFLVTRDRDYSFANIDSETMMASKNDPGAFVDAFTHEVDSAMEVLIRSLAISAYRSGSGSIGRVANSSFATTTLQLTDASEITNIEEGQTLQFDDVDGGGTPHSGTVTVVSVDRNAGTAEVSANLSTITGIAQNDYIFIQGDYDNKVKGLAAWIPDTAPTSGDNFFGVDRSVDSTRLAGIRVPDTGLPIEEALINGATQAGRQGAKIDKCFISFEKWGELVKALGSKVDYVSHEVGEVGFKGLRIMGHTGPIEVYADQNCPSDRAYMLQMDTWRLHSLGQCPHIVMDDGSKSDRQSDADGIEIRIRYYAQIICRAPGHNAVVFL